jgi:radical SAM protein with 4Fe4S-binding SPASM domain
MDSYQSDGHTLNYHVARVSDWRNGKLVYPIYMDVSPSGACNHRCTFCSQDYLEYQPRFLKTDVVKERLTEMGRLGLKSIMYAGEGEPFLHRDMAELVGHTKRSGIDVAVTTNGVLMTRAISERILDAVEWIKVSCNAGTPETYAKIHRTQADQFARVLRNLEDATALRSKQGSRCTLGMQIVLLPDNCEEVETLARLARDIGLDYLVVKPYSHHPKSRTERYKDIRYGEYAWLAETLRKYNTDTFDVIVRLETMNRWDEQSKPYDHCYALSFWAHLDAGGNVWGCSNYLGDEPFCYGNIYEKTFAQIWEGPKRMQCMQWVENELDSSVCRVNCRMDKINRYLWELRHPPAHVNFI